MKIGSPVGAVGLALHAVNEVKLDRADSGCVVTSCVPSMCMLCIYCSFSTACPFNRLWGSKGRGSDGAPELYRIVQ